jgi:aryl-phospho-beta-D-glucosidase BglC (GH1 family)
VFVVTGLAATAVPAAAATIGCSVAYQNLSAWQSSPTSGGFNTTLAITDLGDSISHWTLTFTPPGGTTVTSGWNASFAIGSTVSASDAGWNGGIATGATNATVGIQGTWSRSSAGSAPPSPFPQPTDFTLNGVQCTGGTNTFNVPPTISLVNPSAGQAFATTAAINFAATASDPDGSVVRVDFLNGSTVIGSDTTAPYTFAWTNVAAGTYSVSARAVDNSGATTSTTPITISAIVDNRGAAAPALHVSGNQLATAAGATYRMLGVNRSSGEFACIQGRGMWDAPTDQTTIDAMKMWNVRAVRIPLNEECWLGTANVPAGGTSGAAYQQAVKDWVNLLVANGINPILDLHWTLGQYSGQGAGCPDVAATCQKPMPDAQLTPTFWSQVATAFKGNNAVIFDLFNEPFPDFANGFSNPTAAWTCLRDGGTCTGIGYQVAGMQSLVNAVRATGATNVIMVPGLAFTNDLSQWLAFRPTDSTGNLIASWHSYSFNTCVTQSCWDSTAGTVARQTPVMIGEIGQNTCAHDYIDRLMAWADGNGLGYAAWTWNAWGLCNSSGNDLILDNAGTPTSSFGEGFKAHLLTQ